MLTTIVHFYFLLVVVTTATCDEDWNYFGEPSSNFAKDVNLIYYKCNNETPATIAYPITAPEGLLNVLEDKRTIFYVFGFLQFPEDENVKLMMKALCYGRTDNIVLLDWSKYSIISTEVKILNVLYPIAFLRAHGIGKLFGQSIRQLVNSGLNVSNIYLVGYSLGAHIAGIAARCNNDNFTIPRIIGLDPANRAFSLGLGYYLRSTDAAWVDVIHTDMGRYGTSFRSGTADYYPNNGRCPQPGCSPGIPLTQRDICCHQKSVVLYAESKMNPTNFSATQFFYCPILLICKRKVEINFGYGASKRIGSYYFDTTP
ncbi:phospholipase A1-like [Nylanderia fulva]|uniref:phospholipase A1-like n=1 Tax=Nylanderia fulva TaxID=613905 RepID=UPI0010FB0D72|nr:phospholipase A1-like [Nylanderia fulva]